MIRRIFSIAAALLCIALIAAGNGTVVVTGQLLDYESGFVFFTSGDGFRVSPAVTIKDAKTNGPTALVPSPRMWARATFDSTGTVTELDLSRSKLPAEGNLADVAHFAVALSPPLPNPDLSGPTPEPGASGATPAPQQHFSGKPVLVTFTVQVPPQTPFSSYVYITTDASGWNAQAIPLDRIDALHYNVTRRLNSGTVFHYLYDRGSFQQVELAQNGLQRKPRSIVVTDADVRVVRDTVYAWVDLTSGGQQQIPTTIPTPYNPGPFPNLPNGIPTPGCPPPKCP
jgi:hypothetical protein